MDRPHAEPELKSSSEEISFHEKNGANREIFASGSQSSRQRHGAAVRAQLDAFVALLIGSSLY